MVDWRATSMSIRLKHVQSAEELEVLEDMYWHDCEAVTGLITRYHQDEFPGTINYSRIDYPNVHLLCRISLGPAPYIELVFVAVEKMDLAYLNDVFIRGSINRLSNIVISATSKKEYIRAAALLYRFLDLDDDEARDYYRKGKEVRDFDSMLM
jgi:hypothetical protein